MLIPLLIILAISAAFYSGLRNLWRKSSQSSEELRGARTVYILGGILFIVGSAFAELLNLYFSDENPNFTSLFFIPVAFLGLLISLVLALNSAIKYKANKEVDPTA